MTKLFFSFLLFIVMGVVLINSISDYLGPDDIKQCDPYPSTQTGCKRVDAIVAISGGDTVARAAAAIDLYKRDWAPKLVFSGAAADKSGPSNAETMKVQAIESGVPAAAILLDETSETTKQNASNAIGLLQKNGIESVILVTSAYHQRRADLEFGRRAGSEVAVVNHPVKTDTQWSQWWWTTPTGWFLTVSEMVKIILFYVGVTQ